MSIFNVKTVLLVVVLISLREILRMLSNEDSIGTKKISSSRWRSRRILQQVNETENSTSRPKSAAVKCSDVISKYNRSLICHYIKTTPDCQLDDGFIQYLYLPYCLLPRKFAFCILAIWLIYLFVVLGITTDDYFCPSLVVIAKTLKMSQNVAGITFLAFGNGAPDIFSAIAAFSHIDKEGNNAAELGIQAILGSCIFLITVVFGSISLCTPNGFTVTNLPFIRDILFYIASIALVVIVLYDQQLSMLEAIGLIILYVIYVKVVVCGHYFYQYWKRKKTPDTAISFNVSGEVTVNVVLSGSTTINSSKQDEKTPLIKPIPTLCKSVHPGKKLLYGILPFTYSDWKQSGLFGKIFMVFKAPVVFLLNITVPTIDYSEPDQKWNKWLNVIHCITGPLFVVMAIKVVTKTVASHFPVWALTLSIGVLLALVVATLTSSNQPPRFHWMFAYLAFIAAVIWIYLTANEIVNLLQTFGVVFHLSDSILGLTFLAWGGSIGDFVSTIVMARQGFTNMAASACLGGTMLMFPIRPSGTLQFYLTVKKGRESHAMFRIVSFTVPFIILKDLLLGIGIACTLVTVRQGHSVVLPQHYHQYIISSGFLMLSLISSGIIIPLMGFRITRSYGVYLLVIYLLYLMLSIIAEVKHI